MKKKIISIILLGFILAGSVTHWVTKPVKPSNAIVLEFDEGEPEFKVGG